MATDGETNQICVSKKLKLALNAAKMYAYERDLRTNVVTKTFSPSSASTESANPRLAFLDSNNVFATMTHEESIRLIYADDRARVEAAVQKAIDDQGEFEIEFRVDESPGTFRWVAASGRALYEDDGTPTHVYAVSQDITEKKRLEDELTATRDQLARALDAANMAAFESFGKVKSIANSALKRLLGFNVGAPDITREIFLNSVHPEDREMMSLKIRSTQPVVYDEFRVVHPSGQVRWLLAKGSVSLGSPESVEAYIVIQDITKRKTTQDLLRKKTEELSAVNKKLEGFSAVVAHDLKGPLSTLTMSAELAEDATTLEGAREFLGFIKTGARRMANLVDDLLAFAKLGSEQSFAREAVSLQDVLKTVCANLKSAVTKSAARLTVGDEDVWVLGHAGYLSQVLQNLIANSLKFVLGQPVIDVSFDELPDAWIVRVKDNGIGLEPAAIEKVFEPFKRFHGSSFEGTGLGLSIVKNIIEHHDGQIWVESEPGHGTSFLLKLPKVPHEHAQTEARSEYEFF